MLALWELLCDSLCTVSVIVVSYVPSGVSLWSRLM